MQALRGLVTLAAYVSYRTEPARMQTVLFDLPEDALMNETGERVNTGRQE